MHDFTIITMIYDSQNVKGLKYEMMFASSLVRIFSINCKANSLLQRFFYCTACFAKNPYFKGNRPGCDQFVH